MKIIIVLLLVSNICFGSGISDKVKQTIDSAKSIATNIDTSSVTKKIYSDVKDAIGAIASGLKVGAEHVYAVLVTQSIVESIVYLIILITSIILGVVGLRLWVISRTKNNYEYRWGEYLDPIKTIISIFFVVVSLVLLIMSLANFNTIVTGVVNPEFGAIEKIIEMLKSDGTK